MPDRNAIVSRIRRFNPPLDRPGAEMLEDERGLAVDLEDGQQVRLDPADSRSAGLIRVLEGLRQKRLLAYFEVDPETSYLKRLLIPRVTRVLGIRPIDEGVLGVELELSHGRHVIRSSNEDFEELEAKLREALEDVRPVVITEDDAHNIIDVRFFEGGPDGPDIRFPRPSIPVDRTWWDRIRSLVVEIREWKLWPWWWFRCVTPAKAQQAFDAMAAESCDPMTVPPPCIPFMYPDDGCWARAHEMCRLMIDMGLMPRKVWIQGDLYVSTRNNPNCGVHWGWHVAPTLCVRRRFWCTDQMVIDPALFTTPVTKTEWKGVQGDPSATLTPSDASVFHLWANTTDPSYAQTNSLLDYYRLKLQNRAVQQGPPPYASCP
jgi:hypothetical protein